MADEIITNRNFIYDRLCDIVGSRFVSKDPCALLSYASQASAPASYGKERLSDVVVLPSITPQVQNIVTFAQRSSTPVALYSSAIAGFWSTSKHGGIVVDMKRMNRILKIDEDNCLVTAQAGIPLQRLTAEMLKKRMFLTQAGAPSTCLLASQYTAGNVNKASGRIGWQYRSIVGWEMVLPDGTILRNGSRANAYEPEQFWAHGPGPDLWLLPRYAISQFGVVTEMTIKGHTLDEEIKPFWVSFNDIEDAQKAYIEFVQAEICTGSSLYTNFKTLYSVDEPASGYRLTRSYPEIHMVLTLQGTPRRVAWEEKRVRELAEKYKGRLVTDRFPPFQAAVDSQISMAASIYSEFTTRYFINLGSLGLMTGLTLGGLDDIETNYKYVKRLNMEHEWVGDPNRGFYADTAGPGMITYPSQGGHYLVIELMGAGQMTPVMAKAHGETSPATIKFRIETGLPGDYHGGVTVPGRRDYGEWPTYIRLMTEFHKILDPNNVMHPGNIIPPMFR